MRQFVSKDLQKHVRDVLETAEKEMVVLLNRGQPRVVMMSVDEYSRLKNLAGETIPMDSMLPKPLVLIDNLDHSQVGDIGSMMDDHHPGNTSNTVRDKELDVIKRLGLCGKARDASANPAAE